MPLLSLVQILLKLLSWGRDKRIAISDYLGTMHFLNSSDGINLKHSNFISTFLLYLDNELEVKNTKRGLNWRV